MTWHTVGILARQAQPDSALFKSLNPTWQADSHAELLRSVEFSLRQLIFIELRKVRAHAQAPKVLEWPWESEERRKARAIRGTPVTVEEANRRLGWTEQMIASRRMPTQDRHRAFPSDEE